MDDYKDTFARASIIAVITLFVWSLTQIGLPWWAALIAAIVGGLL